MDSSNCCGMHATRIVGSLLMGWFFEPHMGSIYINLGDSSPRWIQQSGWTHWPRWTEAKVNTLTSVNCNPWWILLQGEYLPRWMHHKVNTLQGEYLPRWRTHVKVNTGPRWTHLKVNAYQSECWSKVTTTCNNKVTQIFVGNKCCTHVMELQEKVNSEAGLAPSCALAPTSQKTLDWWGHLPCQSQKSLHCSSRKTCCMVTSQGCLHSHCL